MLTPGPRVLISSSNTLFGHMEGRKRSLSGIRVTGRFHLGNYLGAGIIIVKGDVVLVGRDQAPHVELTREITRRFNRTYGPVFPEPQVVLNPDAPIVKGTDGKTKMSKSLKNIVGVTDPPDVIRKQVMSMVTDTKRVYKTQPGHPRTFRGWWMARLLTAMAAIGLATILVLLWPGPRKGQRKVTLPVRLPKGINALADGDAIRFDAPSSPNAAFIMADGGGDNAAGDLAFSGYVVKTQGKVTLYAINCPHLECSYALNQDAKTFDCPCHASPVPLDRSVLHVP